MSTNQLINILLIAPKGKLGSLILKNLLSFPNISINILLQDPSKDKNLAHLIENSGGKVLKGDLKNPQTLKNITQGIHTVISAYRPLEENIHVEGHFTLIQDCIENGVQRFVLPSFGLDISRFSAEELSQAVFVPQWLKLKNFIEAQPLNVLEITQGIYIEAFLAQGFNYWGDIRRQIELTCYEESARVIAEAVARADLMGKFHVSGQKVMLRELVNVYNRVKGTGLEARSKGNLEELKALIQDKRQRGDVLGAKMLRLELIMNDERSVKESSEEDCERKNCLLEEFLSKNIGQINFDSLC